MACSNRQSRAAWGLGARQHGVIGHRQLLTLGYSRRAIAHRVAKGRLHPLVPGVYAIGRPDVDRLGQWMAAALSCSEPRRSGEVLAAGLSNRSAGALWGVAADDRAAIHVTLIAGSGRSRAGLRIHRRPNLPSTDLTRHRNIPVTNVVRTLMDLATELDRPDLERAVNEADKLDLIDPESLRVAIDERAGQRGAGVLRTLLDRLTFRLTDSELERMFLGLARRAGLGTPLTRQWVNGHRVDFHWPDLGLIVETDGLRYHRTPSEQAADRRRDQAHAAAGLTPLRFIHSQVRYAPGDVVRVLEEVVARLRNSSTA